MAGERTTQTNEIDRQQGSPEILSPWQELPPVFVDATSGLRQLPSCVTPFFDPESKNSAESP